MEKQKRDRKSLTKTQKIILICVCAVLLVLIAVGVAFLIRINDPGSLFDSGAASLETPYVSATPEVTQALPEAEPTPTPTPDPYDVLAAQADTSMMHDIVNILVVGVDYAEERETWEGKHAYHADVMLVLAINFKENTVDMISLPRDTYAEIPGVKGIYKLNASIDCGGGFPDGLSKVCESAQWMLGGIPVDYYYAVTMPVVKELVNSIGGVDYDVDVDFTLAGREYKKGMQHLDGQGVLDYLRVRKNVSDAGDLNRINRQKNMLIALYRTMKQKNLLVHIPDIVKSFEGKLLTNTTLEQTAALGLFAYNLDEENIRMHSMTGTYRNIFNWRFVMTDQKKRVSLIDSVYGVKVDQYQKYSMEGAIKRWNSLRHDDYISNAEKMIAKADAYYVSATDMSGVLESAKAALLAVKNAFGDIDPKTEEDYTVKDKALEDLVIATDALQKSIGAKSIKWEIKLPNEIDVDFR